MTLSSYPRTEIVIGNKWIGADQRQTLANINPATGEELGRVPCVTVDDLVEVASGCSESVFAVEVEIGTRQKCHLAALC
jgi:acyl-CoA reductase-like NAD-dependent aldehyde dehydrogenase